MTMTIKKSISVYDQADSTLFFTRHILQTIIDIVMQDTNSMACFCGCNTYHKSDNGFKIACTECGHGPQNHDDEFRASARKNESQSQKRDADFG